MSQPACPTGDVQEFNDPKTGRRIRRLTSSAWHNKHSYYDNSAFSPDGSLIAYSCAAPGTQDARVCVMNADGSGKRCLAEGGYFWMHVGVMPIWDPDGASIYFQNGAEEDDGFATWADRVWLEDGRLERVLDTPVRQLSWANRRVLWMEQEGSATERDAGLWSAALDGSDRQRLCSFDDVCALSPTQDRHATCTERFGLTNCKWSPDGEQAMVVLVGKGPGNELLVKEIYICDADGSNLHFVMEFRHHHMWHPNSRQVIGNCNDGLYICNADGSGKHKISDLGSGHPSFSPDGSMITTDVYGQRDELVLIDPETGDVETLCDAPCSLGHSHGMGVHPHPSWAPDSKSVIFDAAPEDTCDVFQVFVG